MGAGGGLEPPTCCLQDSSGSSTASWRVVSWQLRSGGSSSQCAPVGPSSAGWNDRNDLGNDIRDQRERGTAGVGLLDRWRRDGRVAGSGRVPATWRAGAARAGSLTGEPAPRGRREGQRPRHTREDVEDQRDRRALLVVQEEVSEVEQRLGPADLAEVDQPGVTPLRLEDRCGVEVAVGQPSAIEFPAALAGHQLPEPVQLRGREQRPQRPRPRIGKVGDHELAVVMEGPAQRPDWARRWTQPKPCTPTPWSTASSAPAARATRRAAHSSRQWPAAHRRSRP